MDGLTTVRRLWDHAAWADQLLLAALVRSAPPGAAWREYSHVLGAESVWLDRLLHRPAQVAVWPELAQADATSLSNRLRTEYEAYLDSLSTETLDDGVTYTNSAGHSFTTSANDILLHVALHGQYHRGKVNLLLRQHDASPVPTDFIAFVRGVSAATTTRTTSTLQS